MILEPMAEPPQYRTMPEDEYNAAPAVRSSLLKFRTLAEMRHSMSIPGEPREHFAIGTILHAIVLEPWKFAADQLDKHFQVFSETKTLGVKAIAAWDRTRHLVTPEMIETALRLAKGLATCDMLKNLLGGEGMREASLIGFDPINNVRRKIRVDYLPMRHKNGRIEYGPYLLDIKTSSSHPADFPDECWRFGYFLQAAYYLDTHELLTGHRPKRFVWLVVSKKAPNLFQLYQMANLPRDHALYTGSKLEKARIALGLDVSAKVGRLPMLAEALRRQAELSKEAPESLQRAIWEGYENTEPYEIL